KVRLDHLLSKDIVVKTIGTLSFRSVMLYACLFSFEGAIFHCYLRVMIRKPQLNTCYVGL
ncbi:hypothetical protein, partial [Mesobacillus harenae]|uniref:hypothetical protein n=1 Tax=Mesobacillus harenae TaxID=2213203 RepID=UPI001A7E4F3B